jgi:hypothetical protein
MWRSNSPLPWMTPSSLLTHMSSAMCHGTQPTNHCLEHRATLHSNQHRPRRPPHHLLCQWHQHPPRSTSRRQSPSDSLLSKSLNVGKTVNVSVVMNSSLTATRRSVSNSSPSSWSMMKSMSRHRTPPSLPSQSMPSPKFSHAMGAPCNSRLTHNSTSSTPRQWHGSASSSPSKVAST